MSSLTEAEISSMARAKWWERRMRLGGVSLSLLVSVVGGEGEGGEGWGDVADGVDEGEMGLVEFMLMLGSGKGVGQASHSELEEAV